MTKESIIFLLSVSVVTLGLSFFTAFLYTKAIPMSPLLSRGIRIAGFVFPFIFVLANALSRFSNLEFVKWIYTFMSVGAGIAFYLLLGAILLGLLMLLYKIFGKSLPVYVSWIVLITSTALSILGFIQARDIKKVSYEVAIENLPRGFENKKAILFSDTHYGLVNNKRAVKRLVNKINGENPDLVFIAGDLFDGPDVKTSPMTALWSQMSLKYPVFYAPGNHEEYGNYGKFITSIKDAGFFVLEDQAATFNGVNIVGLKYRSKNKEAEVAEVFENLNIENDFPTFVINHPPTFLETLEVNGADLMMSGHTHRGQFWPLRYITKAIYGKYHYGLNTFKGLQIITTSGVGTAGPPVRLFNTPEIVEITFKAK